MAKATRTPNGPLVRAIYWALNVNAIRVDLGAGVYGDVPQAAALPYLRIDVNDAIRDDTMGLARNDTEVTIDVFSATGRNADDIADAVVLLVDRVPLQVEGHSLERIKLQQSPRGSDEILNGVKTFHRVLRFRAWLRELPA